MGVSLFLTLLTMLPPQDPQAGPTTQAAPAADAERDVSWKALTPNIGDDQKRIWTFPLRLRRKPDWIPAVVVLGATAGLIAVDHLEAASFRGTTAFNGFNSVFNSNATIAGILATPFAFYTAGLIRHDRKMQKTALLSLEALADSEIVATVIKDATRRQVPATINPNGNFSDSWGDNHGSYWKGNGSFPSGHAIAAFSVATIVARRYRNHRWAPFAAYGMAGLVAFSRLTLSAHFLSDVFMGGALGYSISRFTVLRE